MINSYLRILQTLVVALMSLSVFSQDASDIYESYIILDINNVGNQFYDLNVNTALPNFDGANLGTFLPGNSLILNGAQNQTYKCGTHNIMNGFIDYRIYEVGDTPPGFTPSEILFFSDDGTSNFCGGTSNDQTWESFGANIDILNGLGSGDYILEVYTRADADYNGDDIPDNTYFISNLGANYSATFRVDNPPVANCQDIAVQLDASGNITITGNDIDNGSTDDFGIASLSVSTSSFTCADIGPNNVTLTVTDTSGQTDTCTAVVTIQDNVFNPTFNLTSSLGTAACGGDAVVFTAAGTNLGANPQYEWFINGVSIGNNSDSYTTSSINDNDVFYVEVISGPCNTMLTSNTLTMSIFQPATADAGPDQSMCNNETFFLMGTFGGSASSGSWTSASGGFVDNEYFPSISGGTVVITYVTDDPPGPCGPAMDSMVMTVRTFRAAIANVTSPINDCSDTTVQLSGNRTGEWSAESVPAGIPFTFSNINDPNATFTGESGVTYNVTWTIDLSPPCFDEDTITVTFPDCGNLIDFNGTDSYVNFADNNQLTGPFSMEIWIKPNELRPSIQTIYSKRDAADFSTGYDLRLINTNLSFRSDTFSIGTTGITTTRWYHVAVTFDGSEYRLYIDGELRNTLPGSLPTPNSQNMMLGAMNRAINVPRHYFNGWMDEFRIWDVALTAEQIREMMNQEIEDNTLVRGSELELDLAGLNWSDLSAYYQMNQGTSDVNSGFLVGNKGVSGRLVNMITLQQETAPLPYETDNDGLWDNSNTWLNGGVQLLPDTNNIDWNIVRINHNVDSGNREITVLGLLVDSNSLDITNNQSLRVSKYLKIDGLLDLEGESQLIQDAGSTVNYLGVGTLERDQQGTSNLYNYNYWSSPVSSGGLSYNLANVLYDGTDASNPVAVQWTNSANADGSTSPITMSRRWLYLYENYPEDSYADWNEINELSNISVGLGYTMKGSGNSVAMQNYTFVGQPNNGIYNIPVTPNYQALVGNPYPSAIDANTFITDNNAVLFDGSINFWEQSSSNSSHVLFDYLGGYAYYNLTGGTAAVSPPDISGVGDATTIPERYIPVGQGFFVTVNGSGGNIEFNNDQRQFVTEASGNSVFMRNSGPSSPETVSSNKFIRLDFVTPENATRHLLLGFMENTPATCGVDYGYDAVNNDNLPSDMSFNIEGDQFIIQGVDAFDPDKSFPLDMVLSQAGNIKIKLADIENFEIDPSIYIYDAFENTYTQINDVDFQKNLEIGEYNQRFHLVFQEAVTLSDRSLNNISDVSIRYLNNTKEILIESNKVLNIQNFQLINMIGKVVLKWNNTNNLDSKSFRIPIQDISNGVYILKLKTTESTVNKKLIIKQ